MSNLHRDLILWSSTLQDFRLPRQEELPDFDLYLDQVITLIEGHLQNLLDEEDDTILTIAMVSNYVKLKLIPRAEKKRYNRIHVAYLITITIPKQALMISEVKQGIEYQAGISGLKEAFSLFCEEQETAVRAVADHLENQGSTFLLEGITVQNMTTKMATVSLADKLVAERILHLQSSYTARLQRSSACLSLYHQKNWLPSGNASSGHTEKGTRTGYRAIEVKFPFLKPYTQRTSSSMMVVKVIQGSCSCGLHDEYADALKLAKSWILF